MVTTGIPAMYQKGGSNSNQAVDSGRKTSSGKPIYVPAREVGNQQPPPQRVNNGVTITPSNLFGNAQNTLRPGEREITAKQTPTAPQPANMQRQEAIKAADTGKVSYVDVQTGQPRQAPNNITSKILAEKINPKIPEPQPYIGIKKSNISPYNKAQSYLEDVQLRNQYAQPSIKATSLATGAFIASGSLAFGKAVFVDPAVGAYNIVRHPIKTATGVVSIFTNPLVRQEIKGRIATEFQQRPAAAIGTTIGYITAPKIYSKISEVAIGKPVIQEAGYITNTKRVATTEKVVDVSNSQQGFVVKQLFRKPKEYSVNGVSTETTIVNNDGLYNSKGIGRYVIKGAKKGEIQVKTESVGSGKILEDSSKGFKLSKLDIINQDGKTTKSNIITLTKSNRLQADNLLKTKDSTEIIISGNKITNSKTSGIYGGTTTEIVRTSDVTPSGDNIYVSKLESVGIGTSNKNFISKLKNYKDKLFEENTFAKKAKKNYESSNTAGTKTESVSKLVNQPPTSKSLEISSELKNTILSESDKPINVKILPSTVFANVGKFKSVSQQQIQTITTKASNVASSKISTQKQSIKYDYDLKKSKPVSYDIIKIKVSDTTKISSVSLIDTTASDLSFKKTPAQDIAKDIISTPKPVSTLPTPQLPYPFSDRIMFDTPPIPPPFIPKTFNTGSSPGETPSYKPRRKVKQRRAYTPTFNAIAFNIRGKADRQSTISGLGQRPLPELKQTRRRY